MHAIDVAEPGWVLVVDGGGLAVGYAGELAVRAAQRRRLAGMVLDGGVFDLHYVAATDFPVFSRYVSPWMTPAKELGESQLPISCGGVFVDHGDIVIGDPDGVVVLDPTFAVPVLEQAREMGRQEDEVRRMLEFGTSLCDALDEKVSATDGPM